ncbi:hypothetical protein [Mucilaginibacter pineti]|uniref:hypothetical protein n=1 Tax=Mucilaginibacter pineti TaxID=1391627 RepID=UPI0013BEAA44|nr:hypothetical protein [Mucilaginibacter pineti]
MLAKRKKEAKKETIRGKLPAIKKIKNVPCKVKSGLMKYRCKLIPVLLLKNDK